MYIKNLCLKVLCLASIAVAYVLPAASSSSTEPSDQPVSMASAYVEVPRINLGKLLPVRSIRRSEVGEHSSTQAALLAKYLTCPASSTSLSSLPQEQVCSIMDRQRDLLIQELTGVQNEVKEGKINLQRMDNNELARYYTMVQTASSYRLLDLKHAVEAVLLDYNRYPGQAHLFEDSFKKLAIEPEARIAILQGYANIVGQAAQYGVRYAPSDTVAYIRNTMERYVAIARPKYTGTIKVVDMSNDVRQQPEGNTCGYHALLNAAQLYKLATERALNRFKIYDTLAEGPDIATCKEAMASLGGQTEAENFENIYEDDLTKLIQSAIFDIGAEHVTLVPSVTELHQAFFQEGWGEVFRDMYRAVPAVVKRLKTTPGAAHAFILGTGQSAQASAGNIVSLGGHWFAAVASNYRGTVSLTVADSQGNREFGHIYCPRQHEIQQLLDVLNADAQVLQDALGQPVADLPASHVATSVWETLPAVEQGAHEQAEGANILPISPSAAIEDLPPVQFNGSAAVDWLPEVQR